MLDDASREVNGVRSVFAAESDYAFCYIVRRYRDFDAVAQQYFDVVDAHLARYRAHDRCAVVELDLELGSR